jgi:hypothetical protein
LLSSGYGAIGFNGSAWYIQGNATYGLYINTGLYVEASVYSASSMRAPIFYDLDNTGYYIDPNNNSYVYSLTGAAYLRSNGNIYTDANYGYGLVGVYASTRYQGVFSMGSPWSLAVDGTSTGNLYGLAWSHPNTGGVAAQLNNHGLLVLVNGGFQAAISGSIRAATDVRGPIFYDQDDTGYYIDPNGTSASALRVRGGALFGPNLSWGAYLYVGTNSNADVNTASVAASNGNLHIDAANGYVMYLNYYATSSYTIVAQSCRSPIFYDYNDTGYYCDPNGTSRLAALNINTGNWLYSSEGWNRILFDSSGSTHIRGIWGDAWWIRFGWQNNDNGVIFEGSGNIYAQGNITAYWSDRRLKKNITKIHNWREIVDGLNGYFYEWNDNGKRVFIGDDPKERGVKVGFIAQEVNAVLPQATAVQELQFKNGNREPRDDIADIVDVNDPFLTVCEEKLIPVLTEAIKWLLEKVDEQEERLKRLESLSK